MGGIYIHIPFCKNKCLYCDFYTGGERIADWGGYVECLLNEFEQRINELYFPVRTLYIGGGTPSLIPPNELKKLIEGLKKRADISALEEFTMEANPEDVTPELAKIWSEIGVDRISLGIQTFNDKELKIIGRKHDARKAIEAYRILSQRFENISIDVMFGIPGQSIFSYRETLEKVIHLHPSHISSYSLMLEERTAMTYLHSAGRINLPTEKEWLEMYGLTVDFLACSGYSRYEISNYSLPGRVSKHNLSYWLGEPYLGLGPSAHSFDGHKIRRANPHDLKRYVSTFSSSCLPETFYPFYSEEILNIEERKEEMIMTRLRTIEGLSLEEFGLYFGTKEKENLLQKARKFLYKGFLQKNDNNLRFTTEGFAVSDTILANLI